MTDKTEKKGPFSELQNKSNSAPEIDTKSIVDAVAELNLSRKNISFYPPDHIQVKRSLERAYKSLHSFFEFLPDLTLGIAGEKLLRGDKYLDPDNPVCRDFALSLKRHNMAAITFERELEKDELFGFLSAISRRPEEVEKEGGVEGIIEKGDFPHIKISSVDYSKLDISEEEEISRRPEDKKRKKRELWKEFVDHLLSETIADGDKGVFAENIDSIDPAQMAKLISENRLEADTVMQIFDRVVSYHFSGKTSGEKARIKEALDLANWGVLIEKLNPELKRQFLSLTLKYCLEQGDSERTEEFLASMSGAFVIDMLRQANEEGREISPGLVSLIRKMAGMKEIWQDIPEDLFADFLDSGQDKAKAAEDLREVFKREERDKYIQSEYDDTLERLSSEVQQEDLEGEIAFFRESYLKDLEDKHLNARIARILIGFINRNLGVEEYRTYAYKLVEAGHDLLEIPDFKLLSSILKAFQVHKEKKGDHDIRLAAEESLEKFRDPSFTSRAAGICFEEGGLLDRNAYNFLLGLGPSIVPDLVKMYARRERPHMPGFLPELFTRFRKTSMAEAQKRLRDDRVHVVKNLVVLLRFLGARELENRLLALLEHENTEIRLETLDTLLSFESEWALPVLRKLISSGRSDIASRAIFMAGKYQVEETVPELASKLKRFMFFRSDFKRNREIIAALGLIADPEVIPVLKKIARTSWPLYPAEMWDMKKALFESLDKYPYEYAKPVLDYGCKMRNRYLNMICRRIIEKKTADANT